MLRCLSCTLLWRRASVVLLLLALVAPGRPGDLGDLQAVVAPGRPGECKRLDHEPLVPRLANPHQALTEIVGLEAVKDVLTEAVVNASKMTTDTSGLFWRSVERSGILLAGPPGLGKAAAAESAAAAAGAWVMTLSATDVATSDFCRIAREQDRNVVVIIESLETARHAGLYIQKCLRETAKSQERITIIATVGVHPSTLSASELAPFGYMAVTALPSQPERKQYLLRLFSQISRVDARWASALRESAVVTLANITQHYSFAEIELVVRRAFLRSTNETGLRGPVALHQFEKIVAESPPQADMDLQEFPPTATVQVSGPSGRPDKAADRKTKKKAAATTDPMDGIFGWCNFWLPEAVHLPPVVWAMLIFGILAHFMARGSYPPYSSRKRRGNENASSRSSPWSGDLGGASTPYSSFGDCMGDGSSAAADAAASMLPTTKASQAASFMPSMPSMPGLPGLSKSVGKLGGKAGGDKIEVCD